MSDPLETDVAGLEDLPISAKLVYKVLEREDDLSQSEIAERAYLSRRSARRGLYALEDAGLVDRHPDETDARRTLYALDK